MTLTVFVKMFSLLLRRGRVMRHESSRAIQKFILSQTLRKHYLPPPPLPNPSTQLFPVQPSSVSIMPPRRSSGDGIHNKTGTLDSIQRRNKIWRRGPNQKNTSCAPYLAGTLLKSHSTPRTAPVLVSIVLPATLCTTTLVSVLLFQCLHLKFWRRKLTILLFFFYQTLFNF